MDANIWDSLSENEKKELSSIGTKKIVSLAVNSNARDGHHFYELYRKKKIGNYWFFVDKENNTLDLIMSESEKVMDAIMNEIMRNYGR
jgi:hypothetical protein